jgi:hypothetical protein
MEAGLSETGYRIWDAEYKSCPTREEAEEASEIGRKIIGT